MGKIGVGDLFIAGGSVALAFVGGALWNARWWMTTGTCMLDGPGACADAVMVVLILAWWSFIVAVVFLAIGLIILAKSPRTTLEDRGADPEHDERQAKPSEDVDA